MATVLVVEDDLALRETLVYNLEGQQLTVEAVSDGQAALEAARRVHPDLILLDVMLPSLDGVEVCRILRHEMSIPILMLTARDDEIDRVIGLEIGADDYITKPFSMRELMARVRAHLRRERLRQEAAGPPVAVSGEVIQNGNLELDLVRREVRVDGKPLPLTPKEFDLFTYLVQHRGQALKRMDLLDQVWGWEYPGGTRTVDVHIHGLREKIEVDPTRPVRIVTVRGAGYRFEG
jgi:DNA-binding response OmpR family regulator